MKLSKLKIGKYYLVDIKRLWYPEKYKRYMIAKYLGEILDREGGSFDIGIEFITYIGGHSCSGCKNEGKQGYCLYARSDMIVKKVSYDDVMVELL